MILFHDDFYVRLQMSVSAIANAYNFFDSTEITVIVITAETQRFDTYRYAPESFTRSVYLTIEVTEENKNSIPLHLFDTLQNQNFFEGLRKSIGEKYFTNLVLCSQASGKFMVEYNEFDDMLMAAQMFKNLSYFLYHMQQLCLRKTPIGADEFIRFQAIADSVSNATLPETVNLILAKTS